MSQSRLYALDMLRGCAALLVLVYHFTFRYFELFGGEYPRISFKDGMVGVDIFFVISGFVIYMTLDRLQGSPNRFAKFWWNRFARLFPVFWVAVTATAIVVHSLGLPGRDEISIVEFFKNLTMIPRLLGARFVDGAYWSLEVELIFYFWVVIISSISARMQLRIFMCWLIASVALSLLDSSMAWVKYARVLLIANWFPYFGFGIASYLASRKRIQTSIFLIFAAGFFANACIQREVLQAAIVLAGGSLVMLVAVRPESIPKNSVLVFLGTISYSLYLIHQNIGYVVIQSVTDSFGHPWIGILAAFVTALASAALLTFAVERPCMRGLKRLASPLQILFSVKARRGRANV